MTFQTKEIIPILISDEFSMNFHEILQEAYLPKPPTIPSLAQPNDIFAWLSDYNQDLELGHFKNSNKFHINFNKPLQEAYYHNHILYLV